MMTPLIKLIDIKKSFFIENRELPILRGVNLEVMKGDLVSIIGASGSGKSTLMNIIGLMDKPTSGSYYLDGRDVSAFSDDELSSLRNRYIGFVFQQFHLIPYATALENVIVPTIYSEKPLKDVKHKAIKLLQSLNMGERINNRPNQLSGGEQQRVAIARALVNEPEIILADEPTGALDSKTSQEIMEIFLQLNQQGKTVIIITHDPNIANICKRVVKISDGIVI
ncbi:MAG: ABC transporter ATP-binding protein [bacterium]